MLFGRVIGFIVKVISIFGFWIELNTLRPHIAFPLSLHSNAVAPLCLFPDGPPFGRNGRWAVSKKTDVAEYVFLLLTLFRRNVPSPISFKAHNNFMCVWCFRYSF